MPITKDLDQALDAAEILKALGHPVRLQIVALLVEQGPTYVSDLAAKLEHPQPLISQQLRILRMNGLANVTRKNGHATYSLAEPQPSKLIGCLEKCCYRRRGST